LLKGFWVNLKAWFLPNQYCPIVIWENCDWNLLRGSHPDLHRPYYEPLLWFMINSTYCEEASWNTIWCEAQHKRKPFVSYESLVVMGITVSLTSTCGMIFLQSYKATYLLLSCWGEEIPAQKAWGKMIAASNLVSKLFYILLRAYENLASKNV